MNNDSFSLFTIPFTIIGFLIALKVLLRLYLYFIYQKIIVPLANIANDDKYCVYDIVSKYFKTFKIDNIRFKDSVKPLTLFKNFNHKTKEFTINNLHHDFLNTNLCQLNFDYILTRCWLAQKMIHEKSEYRLIKFTYYILPIINAIIFWLSSILLITFNIICYYSEQFRNNSFIYKLNEFKILLAVLTTTGCFSIIYVFIASMIKSKLENEYEKTIKSFVIEHFSNYYQHWLTSRFYSRSIRFANFHLQRFSTHKNQEYKYLGPFVKV